MAAAPMTPADLATELGTDAKTVRKFLRTITPRDEQPGKGSRWSIERKALRSLKSQFAKFEKAQADARAERAAKRAEIAAEAVEALDTDDAEVETLDDAEGPTDADLEMIDSLDD